MSALLAALAPAPAAQAGGLVRDPDGEPALCVLSALQVQARLDDDDAVVTEQRRYRVPTDFASSAEGPRVLRFLRSLPAHEHASVVELRVAGEPHAGSLLDGPEADAVREALSMQLRDPAPLRELGSALYVADFELAAGTSEVEVVLTTRLPLRSFGTLQGVALSLDWHKQAIGSMEVGVEAHGEAPLRTLLSPYHELSLRREDDHNLHGQYTGRGVCTELELLLLLGSGGDPFRLDFVPFRRSLDEDGHFLALLSPPLHGEDAPVSPRDLAIAVDVSGSMRGDKLEAARQALLGVLDGLRPDDNLALISFEAQVDALAPQAAPATGEALDAARAYVGELVADGGTNLHQALRSALSSLPSRSGRPRYVVLLTDGVPTEGVTEVSEIVADVTRHNEIGARVFAFGIGDDVNTVLLDRLAEQSSGAVHYIRPGDSIGEAVASFFADIRDPVLTDPVLELGALAARDTHPAGLPDLFAGQTLSVLGRFDFAGETTVTLRGRQAGRAVEQRFSLRVPEADLDNAYAARIWALRHVGSMLEAVKQGRDDPALHAEIARIARRFGVETEFTRFEQDADGDAELVYDGVPTDAVGSRAVDTSTTLSGYASGGAVEATANRDLRYFADRTLLWRDGFYTDTALPDDASFVDLRFGSERYFELLRGEAAWGAPGLLSTHAAVRFELLGRAFRVSADDAEDAPAEDELPAPAWRPVVGPTEVRWLGASDAPANSTREASDGAAAAGAVTDREAEPGAAADDEAQRGASAGSTARYGCQLGPSKSAHGGGLALGLLALLAWAQQRRRARET